ncbi:hypothetical protein J2T17_002655 [Paenibacillus mucilaginosus]
MQSNKAAVDRGGNPSPVPLPFFEDMLGIETDQSFFLHIRIYIYSGLGSILLAQAV